MSDTELSPIAELLAGKPDESEGESPELDDSTPPDENLSETAPDEPESSDETDQDEPEKAEPLTVKQLAEKLETSPKALYEGLTIKAGNSELTLGQVKDRMTELLDVDKSRSEVETLRTDTENELLRKNREVAFASQKYGRQLTPADQQELTALHKQYVDRENKATLAAIPGWDDPATMTHEMGLIGDVLDEYGFSPVEKANTFEHRFIKMARDLAHMRERLAKAKDAEERKPGTVKGKSKRKSAPKKLSAVDSFKSGELNQNQAILKAISDGVR